LRRRTPPVRAAVRRRPRRRTVATLHRRPRLRPTRHPVAPGPRSERTRPPLLRRLRRLLRGWLRPERILLLVLPPVRLLARLPVVLRPLCPLCPRRRLLRRRRCTRQVRRFRDVRLLRHRAALVRPRC